MTTQPARHLGHRAVVLEPASGTGRMRMPAAQVLLAVLAGEVELDLDAESVRLFWGEVRVVPPGRPWAVRALQGPARLLVVAVPSGPEGVVAALCAEPRQDPQARLRLAREAGVELLL